MRKLLLIIAIMASFAAVATGETFDNVSITDSIKKVLNTNYFYYRANDTAKRFASGNAIFSKLPIIDTGFVHLPDAIQTDAIFMDVQMPVSTCFLKTNVLVHVFPIGNGRN